MRESLREPPELRDPDEERGLQGCGWAVIVLAVSAVLTLWAVHWLMGLVIDALT